MSVESGRIEYRMVEREDHHPDAPQSHLSHQSTKRKAVHIIVHGFVQGVGFRYYTQTYAVKLGIGGWVRNKADGTVEIWAEGRADKLQAFIDAVRRGPTYSQVRNVGLTWESPQGYSSFHIRF